MPTIVSKSIFIQIFQFLGEKSILLGKGVLHSKNRVAFSKES